MSAPGLDDRCRLEAIPHPLADLLSSQSDAAAASGPKTMDIHKILPLIKQALELYGSSGNWPKSKTVQTDYDSKVDVTKGKAAQAQKKQSSAAQDRLAKCAWHARKSIHDPAAHSHKLGYHDFYEGLAVDHPIKERQYIHDMLRYDMVQGEASNLQAPSVVGTPAENSIAAMRGDVWISEYTTPPVTSNRDFCELFFTVEFQPHPDPLSAEHIKAIVADIEATLNGTSDSAAARPTQSPAGRRSCINIQLPIATQACPPQNAFVRAFYVSVELLRELEGDKTEWWMAVQSDTAGQLPLLFQEMAMPSKIAPDVPLFIGWAVKQKQGSQ